MSSEVIHLQAYRSAIFRGSRSNPDWLRTDIEMCERQQQSPQARRVIERIAGQARAERDRRERRVLEMASGMLPTEELGS